MNAEIYNTAEQLVGLLKEKKLLMATAESCTGGLVSSYITAVPGSSAVFELGVASYSCRIKNEVLGVKKETLDTLGAVSFDAARQSGDTGLVDTSYGTHIMYFSSFGLPRWKAQARTELIAKDYQKDLAAFSEKYELKENEELLNKIDM